MPAALTRTSARLSCSALSPRLSLPRQLYFADLCRASSNYILITECVQFAPRGPTTKDTILDWRDHPPRALLPKVGKYQDDRLKDAHLYCAHAAARTHDWPL